MPKRTDIKSILIIGSGPIVIGQASEFDYSGAEACKALREEGFRVILVNSNPATIMTDPEMADAIYIEPIFSFVNYVAGGGVWDPSIRGIYALPAKLQLADVISAVALSLGLSFVVTIFPARRAARMNPVEALRYE